MSYSFFMDRPGLKDGFKVCLRLRIVDTIGQVAPLASLVTGGMAILGCISLRRNVLFDHTIVDFLMMYPLFLVFCLTVKFTIPIVVWVYVLAVRFSGLLSEDEMRHIPLRYERGRVDPWPNDWRKPK